MDRKTVTLSDEDTAVVDALVESGDYASAEDVVRDAIGTLIERRELDDAVPLDDAELERWLREDVQPVYEAMQRDPSRGLSLDEVKAHLDEHRRKRKSRTG